jgi:hypothetical protein
MLPMFLQIPAHEQSDVLDFHYQRFVDSGTWDCLRGPAPATGCVTLRRIVPDILVASGSLCCRVDTPSQL